MMMLDDFFVNNGVHLDFCFRCKEQMGTSEGRACDEKARHIEKCIRKLVYGNRVAQLSGKSIVPYAAQITIDLDQSEIASLLNGGEHRAPALCLVIGKGRQRGRSCN